MAAPTPDSRVDVRRTGGMQRRGVERVQALLDAAEALHAEQGYEAATLKAIGARAGIPTASVYHYFADRHEIDIELMLRHRRQLDEQIDTALAALEPRTLRDAIDAIVDTVLAYYRQHPSVVELWFIGRHNKALGDSTHDWDEQQAKLFWQYLADRQLIASTTPELALHLAFEAGDRLFEVAFRRSPTGDDAVIDEARKLITAYIETHAR